MKRLLIPILLFTAVSTASGQHWQKLPILPFQGHFVWLSPYFINPNLGFVFNAGVNVDQPTGLLSHLQRTTDGGQTWIAIPYFDTVIFRQGFVSQGLAIAQMAFVSPAKGYVAAVDPYGAQEGGGIFETVDSGILWKQISPDRRNYLSIYVQDSTVFAWSQCENFLESPILFSKNDGLTWDSIRNIIGFNPGYYSDAGWFQPFYSLAGNRSNLIATVYFDSLSGNGEYASTFLIYSTDLGASWQSVPMERNYDQSAGGDVLFIPPHSCKILRELLDDADKNGDTYSFVRADPDYGTWSPSVTNFETGAWVAGTSCVLYLSSANIPSMGGEGGFLRSLDNGGSWSLIDWDTMQGPSFRELDDDDRRNLCAVGYGAVVYAGDIEGNLWKSTDGGDGTLSEAGLAPQIEFRHGDFPTGNDTLIIPQCTRSTAIVYYHNLRCAITTMDSISLTGIDSSKYSLTMTHHDDCLSLPDSTYIHFSLIRPGTYPITIHSRFTDDEYNVIDTSLTFILSVSPDGSSVPLTLSFQSSSMNASPGDTISVPVYLNGTASLGATSITLPFGIDTNILWPVGFESAINGLTVDSSHYSGGTEAVLLQTDSAFSLKGQTLLGYLRCVVYLTDTLSTAISIPTASLNSPTVPCTTLSLTTDSIEVNVLGCGTKTLQQFMLGKSLTLGIRNIIPNPAVNEITIIGSSAPFTITDPLGRSYSVPNHENVLDISSLPTGVYFVSDGISGAKFVKK